MAIMDLFTSLQTIVNERFAKDVRQAIHDGVYRANQVADENKDLVDQVSIRQDAVEQYNNQMITEMTDKDVISAPELIESRDGEVKLSARLDRDYQALNETVITETDRVAELITTVAANVLLYKHLENNGDWTQAIQTALDNHTHVLIPFRMRHTGLTVSKFGATISGAGSYYGDSILEYEGNGTAIKVNASVEYFRLQGVRLTGVVTVPTDYYNSGSIGIDISEGTTSVIVEGSRIDSFETLVHGNFNSFYNKFLNNRLDRFRVGLNQFNTNNLHLQYNRVLRFNTLSVVNGSGGPYSMLNNSFEIFNGHLIQMVGEEKTMLSFKNNYIEIYDTMDLPTNFPTNTFSKPGKFGGNTLFTGNYSTITLENNEFQIRGLYRLMTVSSIKKLRSVDNYYHLYESGNNLGLLYSTPDLESFYVNDVMGDPTPGSGGYVRAYSQPPLRLLNAQSEGWFYDAIEGRVKIAPQKVLLLSLQNGWTEGPHEYGLPRAYTDTNGIYLQGVLSGVGKTGNVVANIPINRRPVVQGTIRSKCSIPLTTNLGAGENVSFSYDYATGDLSLTHTAPPTLSDVLLDGAFIPVQI